MDINDQRDFAEEAYNEAEMHREGEAELLSETLENDPIMVRALEILARPRNVPVIVVTHIIYDDNVGRWVAAE